MNGKINKTIERVKRQHEENYGYNSWCDVYEKASNDFFIKSKFNTKNVWVEWRSVTFCIRKKRNSLEKNIKKLNQVNKLIIAIEGFIQKSVIDTYLKLQIPILWRQFFKNIANNGDYV